MGTENKLMADQTSRFSQEAFSRQFNAWRAAFDDAIKRGRSICRIGMQGVKELPIPLDLELPEELKVTPYLTKTAEEKEKLESDAQLLAEMIRHANSSKTEIFPTATHHFTDDVHLEAQMKEFKLSVLSIAENKNIKGQILTPDLIQKFDTWFTGRLEPELTCVNFERRTLFNKVTAELDRKFGGIESRMEYSWTKHCSTFEAFMQLYMEENAVDQILLKNLTSMGPEWALLYQNLRTAKGRCIWNCLEYVQRYEAGMKEKLEKAGYCENDLTLEVFHDEVSGTLPELKFDESAEVKVLKEKTVELIHEARNVVIRVNEERCYLDRQCAEAAINYAWNEFQAELDHELNKEPLHPGAFGSLFRRKMRAYEKRFSSTKNPETVPDSPAWANAAKILSNRMEREGKKRGGDNKIMFMLHQKENQRRSAEIPRKRPSNEAAVHPPEETLKRQKPSAFLPRAVEAPSLCGPTSNGLGLGLYISATQLHYAAGPNCTKLTSDFDLHKWIGEPHSNPKINDAKVAFNLHQLLTHSLASKTTDVFTIDSKRVYPYAEEIAAVQLTYFRHTVERSLGTRLKENHPRLVIAVPANVSCGCRRRFKTACAIAKLDNVLLVQPTTAIAVAYATTRSNVTNFVSVFIKPGLVEASVFDIEDAGFCSSKAIEFSGTVASELDSDISQVLDQVLLVVNSAVKNAKTIIRKVQTCVIVIDATAQVPQKLTSGLQDRFAKDPRTEHINVIPKTLETLLMGLTTISGSRTPDQLYRERYPWSITLEYLVDHGETEEVILVEANHQVQPVATRRVMINNTVLGSIAHVDRQDSMGTFREAVVQRSSMDFRSYSSGFNHGRGGGSYLRVTIDSEGLIEVSESVELQGGGAISKQSCHMPLDAVNEGRERLRLILESHNRRSKGK